MERDIARRISQLRIWIVAATMLAAMHAAGQESKSSWTLLRDSSGATEVSARSEITAPHGSGFAILKIRFQPTANPAAIVYLTIESPQRLPLFPFEKYDGPVDKTEQEFIKFEIAPRYPGGMGTVRVMPNGFYTVTPLDAFAFDTIDKRVVSLLLGAKDGQELSVTVNGPPISIQVAFETTGLKRLLDQIGLRARSLSSSGGK